MPEQSTALPIKSNLPVATVTEYQTMFCSSLTSAGVVLIDIDDFMSSQT